MPAKYVGIVEDEGIVAMDISKCLTGLGYKVDFISDSGEKLLELLDSKKPDLILMDVELKGKLNGLETTRILKEKYDIHIVFLTAFEDEMTLNRMGELSPDGYLVKPFEDDQLEKTLIRVLGSD